MRVQFRLHNPQRLHHNDCTHVHAPSKRLEQERQAAQEASPTPAAAGFTPTTSFSPPISTSTTALRLPAVPARVVRTALGGSRGGGGGRGSGRGAGMLARRPVSAALAVSPIRARFNTFKALQASSSPPILVTTSPLSAPSSPTSATRAALAGSQEQDTPPKKAEAEWEACVDSTWTR